MNSTSRLIIIVVVLNIIISIAYAVYQDPTNVDYGLFSSTIDIGDNTATSLEGESATSTPTNVQEEVSFGSIIRMGWTIFKVLLGGLIPLPLISGMYSDDNLTKIISIGLLIFWSIIYIIIAFQAYLIYKNKKTE